MSIAGFHEDNLHILSFDTASKAGLPAHNTTLRLPELVLHYTAESRGPLRSCLKPWLHRTANINTKSEGFLARPAHPMQTLRRLYRNASYRSTPRSTARNRPKAESAGLQLRRG